MISSSSEWECWDDQLTEESDSMVDELMLGDDIVALSVLQS